jgi:hypothetical protein
MARSRTEGATLGTIGIRFQMLGSVAMIVPKGEEKIRSMSDLTP